MYGVSWSDGEQGMVVRVFCFKIVVSPPRVHRVNLESPISEYDLASSRNDV